VIVQDFLHGPQQQLSLTRSLKIITSLSILTIACCSGLEIEKLGDGRFSIKRAIIENLLEGKDTKSFSCTAKKYVICAGSVLTPQILFNSSFEKASGVTDLDIYDIIPALRNTPSGNNGKKKWKRIVSNFHATLSRFLSPILTHSFSLPSIYQPGVHGMDGFTGTHSRTERSEK